MKQKIIFISLIVTALLLSYHIESFEFIFIALIFFSTIFLIAAGLLHILRRIHSKFFTVPFAIICVCLAGILAALVRPYDEAIMTTGNLSEKLEYAYMTDQSDRMQLRSYIFNRMEERDEIRLKQVKDIYHQEKELKPIDKFHAAFIYHHGNNSNDFATASGLATAAAKSPLLQDHYQVQWLSRAAYDRWMLSIGKPEKYNTQNKFSVGFE